MCIKFIIFEGGKRTIKSRVVGFALTMLKRLLRQKFCALIKAADVVGSLTATLIMNCARSETTAEVVGVQTTEIWVGELDAPAIGTIDWTRKTAGADIWAQIAVVAILCGRKPAEHCKRCSLAGPIENAALINTVCGD